MVSQQLIRFRSESEEEILAEAINIMAGDVAGARKRFEMKGRTPFWWTKKELELIALSTVIGVVYRLKSGAYDPLPRLVAPLEKGPKVLTEVLSQIDLQSEVEPNCLVRERKKTGERE